MISQYWYSFKTTATTRGAKKSSFLEKITSELNCFVLLIADAPEADQFENIIHWIHLECESTHPVSRIKEHPYCLRIYQTYESDISRIFTEPNMPY